MIGFRAQTVTRTPYYSKHGNGKLGYIEKRNGSMYFTDKEGKIVAKIKRYKHEQVACTATDVTSISGGPYIHPDYFDEYRRKML